MRNRMFGLCSLLLLFINGCGGSGGFGGDLYGGDSTPPVTPTPTLSTTYVGAYPISDSQIQLSLGARKGEYEIARYEIYESSRGLIGVATSDTWIDAQLIPGFTYCYSSTAIDTAGNRGVQGVPYCATTGWVSEAVDSSLGPTQVIVHPNSQIHLGYVADEGIRLATKGSDAWTIETASNVEAFYDQFPGYYPYILYLGPYITSIKTVVRSDDTFQIYYNLLEDVHDYKYSLWRISQNGATWNSQRICSDCTSDEPLDVSLDGSDYPQKTRVSDQTVHRVWPEDQGVHKSVMGSKLLNNFGG